jgi:hypothetical protein
MLAAGAATSMAQNVYSLNVVGYVNVSLTNKYNLVANQLDLDGNVTNNTVHGVFGGTGIGYTNIPTGTVVKTFDEPTQLFAQATLAGNGNWLQNTSAINKALSPGNGVFIQLGGANGTPTPINLTFVGNVVQGSHSVTIVGPSKYGIHSVNVPVVARIETDFGFPALQGDQALEFNGVSQTYLITHTRGASSWLGIPGQPTNAIGQAFMIKAGSTTPASRTWTQNFTVQ